jgi:hypothetical protein
MRRGIRPIDVHGQGIDLRVPAGHPVVQHHVSDPFEPAGPSLFRAVGSFLFSIGLVLSVLLVSGFVDRSERASGAVELSGTYLPDKPGLENGSSAAVAFATANFGLRFVDEERVELMVGRTIVDAYYRIENRRLLVEAVHSPVGEKVWIFDIEGDRLVLGSMRLRQAAR